MNISRVEENIILLQFPAEGHTFLNTNILVLISDNKALIVDTGYKRHTIQVEKYLSRNNLELVGIICSHFHYDHCAGAQYHRDKTIYGSQYAAHTLAQFHETYDHLLPNVIVEDKMTFTFGPHTITLQTNPGHSKSDLIIYINDSILYVGDELIYNIYGEAILPYVADKNIAQHISGLEELNKHIDGKTVISTHGIPLTDSNYLQQDIADRLNYLYFINENKKVAYIDYYKKYGKEFVGKSSHNHNISGE